MISLPQPEIPINPQLPKDFDSTRNEDRPPSHQQWWNKPYIVTYSVDQVFSERARESDLQRWRDLYPSGTCYEVRCLDGGAWDRSTWWGSFKTLEEALECARFREANMAKVTFWRRTEGLKNVGGELAQIKRVYTRGKSYPRLTLSIYRSNVIDPGFKVICSIKQSQKAWWDDTNIPDELLPELLEMLEEYKAWQTKAIPT